MVLLLHAGVHLQGLQPHTPRSWGLEARGARMNPQEKGTASSTPINLKSAAWLIHELHPSCHAGDATTPRVQGEISATQNNGARVLRGGELAKPSKDPRRGHCCHSSLPLLPTPGELAKPRRGPPGERSPPAALPHPPPGGERDTCSFSATRHKRKQECFPSEPESICPRKKKKKKKGPGTQTLLCK